MKRSITAAALTSMVVSAIAADGPHSITCLTTEQKDELFKRQFEASAALIQELEFPRLALRKGAASAYVDAVKALAACEAAQPAPALPGSCANERESARVATDTVSSLKARDSEIHAELVSKLA